MMELNVAIAEALGYSPLNYSTDPDHMLWLDKEMRERGYELSLRYHPCVGYTAIYVGTSFNNIGGWGRSDTEIIARALAAYKALTGKAWEGE